MRQREVARIRPIVRPWVVRVLGRHAPRRYHSVTINDVRPKALEKQFEKYFAAICSCGWVRTATTESEVRTMANRHSDNVAAAADRPLG